MAMVQGKGLKYRVWATHAAVVVLPGNDYLPTTDDHCDLIP